MKEAEQILNSYKEFVIDCTPIQGRSSQGPVLIGTASNNPPQGGIIGEYRVIRGGSYRSKYTKCWVFYREKKSLLRHLQTWVFD